MKLDHLLSAAVVACTFALASAVGGCSAPAAQPAKTSVTAPVSDAVAITQLMSAQLPGPTPRVGKPHLANQDTPIAIASESSADGSDSSASDGESAPKTVRRSDGSRRQGGFGTTK